MHLYIIFVRTNMCYVHDFIKNVYNTLYVLKINPVEIKKNRKHATERSTSIVLADSRPVGPTAIYQT